MILFPALLFAAIQLASGPAVAQAKPESTSAVPAQQLPSAREIVDRFVKAIGGEEAFSKLNSQYAKGTFAMPAQGLNGTVEVFAMRPDKFMVKMNIEGVGATQQGYNGKVGWSLDPVMGPMLITGKQLNQLREQADFDALLHKPDDYQSMETIEETEFSGKKCYKVKVVKKSGSEMTEFYDKETGLLAGSVMKQDSPLGELTVTNEVGDYKEFNGVKFATRITQKLGPMESQMKIDTFEFNKVDPAIFEQVPPQIKALTEQP